MYQSGKGEWKDSYNTPNFKCVIYVVIVSDLGGGRETKLWVVGDGYGLCSVHYVGIPSL